MRLKCEAHGGRGMKLKFISFLQTLNSLFFLSQNPNFLFADLKVIAIPVVNQFGIRALGSNPLHNFLLHFLQTLDLHQT